MQQELRTTSLESIMLVHSPGSVMRVKLGCFDVQIEINGVGFKANLIMIDTPGLDIILRMDWLAKHKRVINCEERVVSLVNSDGEQIIFSSTCVAPSQ